MRSLVDARARWKITITHCTNLKDFKKSVHIAGDENPCVTGLRSVYWKTFLLFQTTQVTGWSRLLEDSRSAYAALREHLLRVIENPDELGSSADPLDDDKSSPWNTLRQDEEIRAEIFQDVERCMPEEPYFRQPRVQRMLLDILFVFCKLNQDVGYRQGMHELLAPILWVVDQDAIATADGGASASMLGSDDLMIETLNSVYVEHDTFTLLSLIMRTAKTFYELGEPDKRVHTPSGRISTVQQGSSPIVERSKRIHEDYLARLDPELAGHLTDIEVLPQIFLIRWIRLLFGREFPFDDLLALWDTLLAEDPDLELVDMICCAMLLRIRWQLMEANYSLALMLLLKYPAPNAPNGPKSFVDDAIYMRDNFNAAGGVKIIEQYSGMAPPILSTSRPTTPLGQSTNTRQKLSRTKSPLPSPATFLRQQGGVGELFQGAAKGLYDRGEKLGINQAVRDAVEEAKKNIQGLQTVKSNSTKGRTSSQSARWSLDEGRSIPASSSSAAALKIRNQQLALMLDQATADLRKLSAASGEENDPNIEGIDLVIAKLEFVKIYLEDASLPVVSEASTAESAILDDGSVLSDPLRPASPKPATAPKQAHNVLPKDTEGENSSPWDSHLATGLQSMQVQTESTESTESTSLLKPRQTVPDVSADKGLHTRPKAPLPTRSAIAQSNFAFMLEPDVSTESNLTASPLQTSSPFLKSGRRPTSGVNRQKAAFLFGEDGAEPFATTSKQLPHNDSQEGYDMGTFKGKT